MNELLKNITDQTQSNFSGFLNILKKDNSQHVGRISFYNGDINSSEFMETLGYRALLSAVIMSEMNAYSFVVEPEQVPQSKSFKGKTQEILKKVATGLSYYHKIKKLKPDDEMRITVSDEFLISGEKVLAHEFDLMCTISDYAKIQQIYKNSDLFEYEVTMGLVKLRQKGALKVIKKGSN